MKTYERLLDEEHPEEYNLASFYYRADDFDQSLSIIKRVVNIEKRTLKQEHPHRLQSENLLALCYWAAGDRDAAISILEDVVEVQKRVGRGDTTGAEEDLARFITKELELERELEKVEFKDQK